MSDQDQLQVVYAAGGNPTGVLCYPDDRHRAVYAEQARVCMKADPEIEQFGFLEGASHFQMSGGEFCGNAARVAAMLISEATHRSVGSFTISGYAGTVNYRVENGLVRCEFPDYDYTIRPVAVRGITATLVDLGGIVHVVLPANVPFTDDKETYKTFHTDVVRGLGLQERAAVGVVWVEHRGQDVAIHPVVWVREIDSFFYETSCGSGTLATLIALNRSPLNIFQPTGQTIYAERYNGRTLAITSTVNRR